MSNGSDAPTPDAEADDARGTGVVAGDELLAGVSPDDEPRVVAVMAAAHSAGGCPARAAH